jgi:hypothetical protein
MKALDLLWHRRHGRELMQAVSRVVGVDVIPQPRCVGGAFLQMDALEYLKTADLSQRS